MSTYSIVFNKLFFQKKLVRKWPCFNGGRSRSQLSSHLCCCIQSVVKSHILWPLEKPTAPLMWECEWKGRYCSSILMKMVLWPCREPAPWSVLNFQMLSLERNTFLHRALVFIGPQTFQCIIFILILKIPVCLSAPALLVSCPFVLRCLKPDRSPPHVTLAFFLKSWAKI